MAGKKKTKKVVKKAEPVSTEEAMAKEVESMSDEEAQEIVDPGAQFAQPKGISDPHKEKNPHDKIQIRINIPMKVARKEYLPGVHIIERHQLPVFREIINKKMKADLSMFTGKNFLVERLFDKTLVIKETDKLDLKELTK